MPGRTSLNSLSDHEFGQVARHLNVRNIARLATTQRTVGAMATNVLRNRPAKLALDVLYPKIQAMQRFARAVTAKAAILPRMPLFRFERVVKETYAPFRRHFALLVEREAPSMNIEMRAEVTDPDGGRGFFDIAVEMTIHHIPALTHLKVINDVMLTVVTPSLNCSMMLEGNGFAFRTAKPLTRQNDAAYDPSAIIYVDAALCPGCPSLNLETSHLNYRHLVTRYAILGEKKWCHATMSPAQAFQRIREVCAYSDRFLQPRAMLEVMSALFNDTVARTMARTLSTTMLTARREACRLIAQKKPHEIFGEYPLIQKMLLARTLTGRRAVLSNREIMSLNGRVYAKITKRRRNAIQQR